MSHFIFDESIDHRRQDDNFAIGDAKPRQNVWMAPRVEEIARRDLFCVRRNGSYDGPLFGTLAAAIAAIPRSDIFGLYEVFEGDARLFTFGLGVDPRKFSRGANS